MATVTFFLSAALHRIPATASVRHFVLTASDSFLNKRIQSNNTRFKHIHCSDRWWSAILQTQHTFVIISDPLMTFKWKNSTDVERFTEGWHDMKRRTHAWKRLLRKCVTAGSFEQKFLENGGLNGSEHSTRPALLTASQHSALIKQQVKPKTSQHAS